MLDGPLRQIKDRLLRPAARLVGRFFSPTAVTLLAAVCGVSAAAAVLVSWQAVAILLFLCNRVLDGLDGLIARETGRQTDSGAYLDILLDFLIYALIPLALTYRHATGQESWVLLSLLFASFYINGASWMYLSGLLEKRRMSGAEPTSLAMPGGLVEGAETIVFFGLMLAMPAWLNILFGLMAAMVVLGATLRSIRGFRVLSQ